MLQRYKKQESDYRGEYGIKKIAAQGTGLRVHPAPST